MRISDWSSDVCSSDLPDDHDPSQEGRGRKGVYSCKLEGSAMGTDFYITARSSTFPLDPAHSRAEAAALLVRHRDRHPDAIVAPTHTYFARSLAEIRSEERRVGKECLCTVQPRGAP